MVGPDDDGDLFAWAEGCGPLTRNGHPIARAPWPTVLTPATIVLLADRADGRSGLNAARVEPARFAAMPSIAYRLALVAVGEADLGLSRSRPTGWDFAAGHALVRGIGGGFVDFQGRDVNYDAATGDSSVKNCYGGVPALVASFARHPWQQVSDIVIQIINRGLSGRESKKAVLSHDGSEFVGRFGECGERSADLRDQTSEEREPCQVG